MAKLPTLDYASEAEQISASMRHIAFDVLRRRGLVVAMSGGIDSSCCAALAVRAVGRDRVFGILMPERDSSSDSGRLGRQLAEHLGIPFTAQDIAPTLEAIGCYSTQEAVLRRALPQFGPGWRFKLSIRDAMGGRVSVTKVVAEDPDGARHESRLSAQDYLELVAATNYKQRVRKSIEYFHADRLNYAVTGTPNRLEYDQGFFVKNGDGAADVKPIAHLYKTQVYGMAKYLGLPRDITSTVPTTDTFSLPQGQDEFYFKLPYAHMDLALWHLNAGLPPSELARELACSETNAKRIYEDILSKRRIAAYLHAPAQLASTLG